MFSCWSKGNHSSYLCSLPDVPAPQSRGSRLDKLTCTPIGVQSVLAKHFRERREAMKLTVGQLARLVVYRNLGKGAKRIHVFEQTGHVRADLLGKLVSVLDVDEGTVRSLIRVDRRTFLAEWAVWASVPIKPYVVLKLMPAFYSTIGLPKGMTDFGAAKAFASAKAMEARREVCLVWSRRLSIYFDSIGAATSQVRTVPGGEHSPWMQIGGKKFLPGAGMIGWPRRPEWLD